MSVPLGHDTGDPELGGGTRVFSNPLSIAFLEQDGDRANEADISGTLSPTKRSSKAPRKGVLDVGMSGLKDITAGAVGGLKKLRGGGSSDDGVDPRTRKANETFKRMFKMMDYNHDHSLRIGELRAGLQVLQHAWQQLSKLYVIRRHDFIAQNLVNEGEKKMYDDLTTRYEGASIEQLTAAAKDAWRYAKEIGVQACEVPNAGAASAIVKLILEAEKQGFKSASQFDDKEVSSEWRRRSMTRRKELESMSFSALQDCAERAGVAKEELVEAEGWGKSKDVLLNQITEVRLSALCQPREIFDSLLPCGIAVAETLAGKLPSSIDFCARVRELLEEDDMAVAKARRQLRKEESEWLQQVHIDETDESTEFDRADNGGTQMQANASRSGTAISSAYGDEIHPEYDRLLHLCTDPYLLHIVMPQMEAWQVLFNIFDLKRNGYVALSELQQGLSTACSPEIEIIQTATMVDELMKSMEFVVHEQSLVGKVIDLAVDDDPGFGSRLAKQQECTITRIKGTNPTAVRYCRDAFKYQWQAFVAAVRRIALACVTRSDLDGLDQLVYGLRFVTHTLTSMLNKHLRAGDFRGWKPQVVANGTPTDTNQHEPAEAHAVADGALEECLREFTRNLTQQVVNECTSIMDAHSYMYRVHYANGRRSESDLIRKYVSSYLLRRRVKLLARVKQWEDSVVKKRQRSAGFLKKKDADSPLIKLQAFARGAIARRQLQRLEAAAVGNDPDAKSAKAYAKSAREEKQAVATVLELDIKEVRIEYFDWPSVLIQYLKSRPQITTLRDAALKVLTMLKAARMKEDKQHGGKVSTSDDAYGDDGPPFPEILLTDEVLQAKLSVLRQTLHNWNEMLMMLDQNSSGSLNPMELRCSIMAFSQMGLIAEMLEYQPLNAAYRRYRDRIYKYPSYNSKFKGMLGWDPALAAGRSEVDESRKKSGKKQRKHPYWEKRQSYHVSAKDYHPGHKTSVLPNYPIYTPPGQVLLVGVEGVPVDQHPWALQVEFQFDETDPSAFVGAKKYSVLISSYRNNAIVARLCGTSNSPGVQFLFIKKEAFVDASMLLWNCKQFELDGRPEVKIEQRASKGEEDRLKAKREREEREARMRDWIDKYPRGEGRYEITPFIPMEQKRWYRLEIYGDKMQAVDTPGKSEDFQYKLRVRLDPLREDNGNYCITGKTTLKYDKFHDCIDGDAIQKATASGAQWSHDKPVWNEEPVPEQFQGGPGERSKKLVKPWFSTVWTGMVDYQDTYSIGNVYNNVCSDASDDVEWSIGALRNFSLFSCNRGWVNSHIMHWPDLCPREGNEEALDGVKGMSGARSPRGSPTASSAPHKAVNEEDLRYWLNQAYTASDNRACIGNEGSAKGRWVVKGRYSLSASLRKTKSGVLWVQLRNDWNVDYEPGFPYSNGVVFRQNPLFLASKAVRTTNLIKAMLGAVPPLIVDTSVVPESQRGTEADGTISIAYWRHNLYDTEMDSNTLFCMRGETAKDDPGLNVLFTGKQLEAAMKDMTRNMRVNPSKCKLVTKFFLWPLGTIVAHWRGRKKRKHKPQANFEALETLLYYQRRTTGKSNLSLLWVVVVAWVLLTYTVFGALFLKYSALHSLEPVIAMAYYIWASVLVALEVANEVPKLPSDTSFQVAYKQANLSMIPVTCTRIDDGQPLTVTAMGLLQMVCRLHVGEEQDGDEDEEDEDEGDDEEADPFQIGRSTLDIVWQQHELRHSLPFADLEITAADVIYSFEIKGGVASSLDWDERNGVYMQGMQTAIDLGKPTPKAQVLLCLLSLLNASIGMLHRAITGLTIIGDISGEGSIVIACAIVTFVGSYIVFQTLFRVAFRWYTVLTFMEQLAHVLTIERAVKVHLPCYIDLRHEGNLEAWYSARDYLNAYCNMHVFGMKSQSIVASSLIISAIVSFNAVTNYFADSANIDWSNPGGWFSLLNMLALAALLFLALVALERINAETKKLVKTLDSVGIEVSRTSAVAQTAKERIIDDQDRIENEEEERVETLKQRMRERKKHANFDSGETQHGLQQISSEVEALNHRTELMFDILRKLDVQTNDIINRQEIATEYQYLQNIVAELRDQVDSKKIFGLVVDRLMLSRIFGGVAAVIYLILKETLDALIVKYAPPTFPLGHGVGPPGDGTIEPTGSYGGG